MEDINNANSKSPNNVVNKYTTERLMTMLDKEKLDALKAEFEQHPDGLEFQLFVKRMKAAIGSSSAEKYDLIHGLCRLFAEIDTNEDRKMQWREFTQYVIDAVMKNPIKKNDKGELPTQKELLDQAHLQGFARFGESNCVDCMPHEGSVQKVAHCFLAELLLVVETKSHVVKFVGVDMQLKNAVDLYSKRLEGEGDGKYFVMGACYNEREEILGCACSNKTIQLFSKQGTKFTKIKTVHTKGVQYGIWYLERHKAWITASKHYETHPKRKSDRYNNAILKMLRRHTSTALLLKDKSIKANPVVDNETYGKNYINDWSFNPIGPVLSIFCSLEAHQGRIMDVIELKTPPLAVTCSLDHSIKLWDLFTGRQVGSFKPPHTSGVRGLDYTPEYSGTVLSVGHENFVKVWSAEVAIDQAFVGTLEGHNVPVVSAGFVKRLPYAVSVDERTVIRIWDVRTLECLQSISSDRKGFECNGLCVVGEKRLIIYGRKMVMYDTRASQTEEKALKLMREAYPIKLEFNTHDKAFMVATK